MKKAILLFVLLLLFYQVFIRIHIVIGDTYSPEGFNFKIDDNHYLFWTSVCKDEDVKVSLFKTIYFLKSVSGINFTIQGKDQPINSDDGFSISHMVVEDDSGKVLECEIHRSTSFSYYVRKTNKNTDERSSFNKVYTQEDEIGSFYYRVNFNGEYINSSYFDVRVFYFTEEEGPLNMKVLRVNNHGEYKTYKTNFSREMSIR